MTCSSCLSLSDFAKSLIFLDEDNVRVKEIVGNGHVIMSGFGTKNFTKTVSGPLGKIK